MAQPFLSIHVHHSMENRPTSAAGTWTQPWAQGGRFSTCIARFCGAVVMGWAVYFHRPFLLCRLLACSKHQPWVLLWTAYLTNLSYENCVVCNRVKTMEASQGQHWRHTCQRWLDDGYIRSIAEIPISLHIANSSAVCAVCLVWLWLNPTTATFLSLTHTCWQ